MKKSNLPFILALLLLLSAFTTINSINWKISKEFSIKFTSEFPTGTFSNLEGDILFDENNLTDSKFDLTVEVSSINTGNGLANKHAIGDKWFNAKKYPKIKFVSTKITKEDGKFITKGNLTMHGIEREISIPLKFEKNKFTGTFKVNRLDYKIGKSGGINDKASHELKIDVSVPVSK